MRCSRCRADWGSGQHSRRGATDHRNVEGGCRGGLGSTPIELRLAQARVVSDSEAFSVQAAVGKTRRRAALWLLGDTYDFLDHRRLSSGIVSITEPVPTSVHYTFQAVVHATVDAKKCRRIWGSESQHGKKVRRRKCQQKRRWKIVPWYLCWTSCESSLFSSVWRSWHRTMSLLENHTSLACLDHGSPSQQSWSSISKVQYIWPRSSLQSTMGVTQVFRFIWPSTARYSMWAQVPTRMGLEDRTMHSLDTMHREVLSQAVSWRTAQAT